MKIEQGLWSGMVLQRDARGRCDATIEGSCRTEGTVEAKVTQRGRVVAGLNWKRIGTASGGRFKARLVGVPAGGPYTVELRVGREKVSVARVFVGDVWILGGQSNMQGCGRWTHRAKPHPMVQAFYSNDRWAVAEDPLHNLWDAVDPVHHALAGGQYAAPPKLAAARRGVGPGVAFGQAMFKATGVPQALLACAHGGTSMSQWNPANLQPGEEGKCLYGAMLRRVRKNGGKVAGVVWYQGESDATLDAAPHYTQRMIDFARTLRRDLGNANLPIAIVQLSRYTGNGFPEWNQIQEQQRLLPGQLRNLATVPAVDLPLDDGIHVSSAGCARLGVRLAEAMRMLRGDRKATPPIALRRMKLKADPGGLGSELHIEFDNVVGGLHAAGRPLGFSLLNGDMLAMPPYRVEVRGDTVTLFCSQQPGELGTMKVQYGRGTDPPCNIVDEADRALPVFGPTLIGRPRALTPFAPNVRVTELLPGAAKLRDLACPNGQLNWSPAPQVSGFVDLHQRIQPTAPEDRLLYFSARFECPESMKLVACVGYDGPVKVWVDGKPLFHDDRGTNPAWADKARRRFNVDAGVHEVIVALGTNRGRAWGIFLRLERLDVKRKQLADQASYAMPRWVD